jgi:Zn-dependent protease with chaperone function
MFAVRGIVVSFSVFVLVYCALSLAACCFWQRLRVYSQRHSARHCADLLFALRVFPLVAAAAVTLAFTIPSFLLLEPRAIEEPMGSTPLVLGVCGLVLAMFGAVNATLAVRRASRTIAGWVGRAKVVDAKASIPVLRIAPVVPALTTAGILRPRVLLSGAAEFVLNENELQTALRHEVAHVQRWDNLKKVVLRLVAFPEMQGLETAWLESTEMAADDAAVSSVVEALDLAAALIKLSRLGPAEPPAELTTALVHSPLSSMNARIERLIAWTDERRVPTQKYPPWYGLGVTLAVFAGFAVSYSELLVRVHTATEWLVR